MHMKIFFNLCVDAILAFRDITHDCTTQPNRDRVTSLCVSSGRNTQRLNAKSLNAKRLNAKRLNANRLNVIG